MRTTLLICHVLLFGALRAENHLTTTATERYFNVVRRNLEASADGMPADKYSFRLTAGQMTFAEWLIHSTQRNYSDCAVLKSETIPEAERQAASLKEKTEVSKALKESFAYCADALFNGTMTEGDAVKRLAVVAGLLISMIAVTALLKRRFARNGTLPVERRGG